MLGDKDLPAYVYGDLKREELLRTGSVVLHEHYFANLGGDGKPGGDVLNAIKQAFVSYDQWEAEFKRIGNALGGGSGWVIFAHNLHTGELHNYWSWDHMHNAPTGLPLLVLDMYEHAYQMDYGAAAAKYVDAFAERQLGGGQSSLHERAKSGRRTEGISAVIAESCDHAFVADSFEKSDDFCIAQHIFKYGSTGHCSPEQGRHFDTCR